ncbi:hypothetical protein A6J66_010885 [Yersinia enterocolitica]|nr:hypothetical protein A6J66_010885 [Yersinia enterocolitica]
MPRLIPENQCTSTGWHSSQINEGMRWRMGLIAKTEKEFKEQMKAIEIQLENSESLFTTLSEIKLTPRGIAEIIDVKKYDEITKDFEPIQYLVAFEKRREVFYSLNYIEELKKESYEQYLDGGNDFLSKEEYEVDKKERIYAEFFDISDTVTKILAGDNASIYKEDLKYTTGWQRQVPVKLIDMKIIAFENQLNGFFGGMNDKDNNQIISEIISGSPNGDHIKALKEIPDGYGWPQYGLNQRVWAEVDLNTPDDILFDSFKKFVNEARQFPTFQDTSVPYKMFSDGVVKSSHINKWNSLKLLAYFDLKILSTITNSKLTMKNYGDILFYDDYDVDTTEKVRKTLVPMANEVMSSGYLNNLLKKILSES